MRGLEKLQHDFQNYLLQDDQLVLNSVVNTPELSAIDRLNLYAESYHLRLFDALKVDYPLLFALLGEDEFVELFQNYVDLLPSHYRSIRWFGKDLQKFLQSYSPKGEHNDKLLLQEVTQFECALVEVFDAKNASVVTLQDMASVEAHDWPRMYFKLNPIIQKFNMHWNVVQLWHAVSDNVSLHPELVKNPLTWLLWRKSYEVQFCSLTPEEIYLLDSMQQEKNFSILCEGLCEWVPPQEAGMRAAYFLKKFIMDELISEIKFE